MTSRSIQQAQVRKRGNTPGMCLYHNGNKAVLVCLRPECMGEIACVDCVATNHRGHEMEKLETYATAKKQILKEKVKTGKDQILIVLQQKIEYTKNEILANKTNADNNQEEVLNRCNRMKDELDKIARNYTEKCKTTGEENEKKLTKYMEHLEDIYTEYKAELEKCAELIDKGSDFDIVVAEKDFPSSRNPPDTPNTSIFKFDFKEMSLSELQKYFGDLVNANNGSIADSTLTHSEQDSRCLDPLTHGRDISILDEFDVESDTEYACEFLYPLQDQLYVWFYRSYTVSLINKDGKVANTVALQSVGGKNDFIQDVCVSFTDGTLWSLNKNGKIQQVKEDGKKLKSIKYLVGKKGSPKSLCVTRKEEIVVGVGDPNQIMILTTTGKVTRTVSIQDVGLRNIPYSIVQCRRTGRMTITDKVHTLSVVDENLCLTYTICNDVVTPARGSAIATGYVCENEFRPWRMCFDSDDNLIVVDYDNYSVIMFSDSGRYLRTITKALEPNKPCTVNTTSDSTIWVADRYEKLKHLKYK